MSLQHTADTSRDSFRAHRVTGALGRQQRLVLAFLHDHRASTYTRSELADATGIKLSAICARVNELIKVGAIEELPRRACQVTGVSAHALRLAVEQGALF